MATWNLPTFDGGNGIKSIFSTPGAPVSGLAPATDTSNFFTDPTQKYLEDIIKKRIGQVQTPMTGTLPGMEEFQRLAGSFGVGSQGAGVGAPGAAGTLDPFKSFVNSFAPGVASQFQQYAASRDPNAQTASLAGYASGRNPLSAVESLNQGLAAMGENTWLPQLQQYAATRDANAPVQTISDWLAANANPLAGYEQSVASRVAQLRGNPFDDTYMAARRTAAFGDIEQAREAERQKNLQQMAGRGFAGSSGVITESEKDINRRYDTERASAQNAITQEEFQLRQQNQAQADALEATGAQLRLNATQFAGQLTGQIAQLQQQGLGMSDALAQSLTQLGLTDRAQQQAVLTTVATLTNQGYQIQDALQVALTQAGLTAQGQADQLRAQVAQTGLQEAGLTADLQGQLAGLGTQERGQDLSLQGQLAQANAALQSGGLNALMNYLGMGQNQAQFQDQRSESAVTLAQILDAMARQGLLDAQGTLPNLPNG